MPNWLKGTLITVAALGFIGFMTASWAIGNYNTLVSLNESVATSWSNVENQYQRRADLIPNLVETVKGYANHEKETLEGVIQARASATQMTLPAGALNDPKFFEQYQAAQGQLSAALGKLMIVKEQYPELKADKQFINLQAQLEGTENRIAVARRDYNLTAQQLNTKLVTFPSNLFSGMSGVQKAQLFQAEAGAKTAPSVSFR